MKPSAVRSALATLIQAGEPALLTGPPGAGKSDIIAAVTRELNYDLILTMPVVDDPTDYKGLPARVDTATGPTAEFLPFGQLQRMATATEPTVVVFEDLGQAAPAVQAAVMQLLLARRINGLPISDEVRFVGATNRREDKAGVAGILAPLLDRFTAVLPMEFDVDEWVAWGLDNNMPLELLAFARFKPEQVSAFVAEDAKGMKKSATPRSVAGLGRLVNLGVRDPDVLKGAAGESFGMQFLAFRAVWDRLPNRTEIYMNPDSAPVPDEPDVRFALMGSLAHAASRGNIDSTLRYLARLPREYSVFCLKAAAKRNREIMDTHAFVRWATENADVFSFDTAA
ncbi:MAG TPA: ATP-binding protein [Longimicrobium sp.]|nr:ATP-binding protein [Longimicrobium sp.]